MLLNNGGLHSVEPELYAGISADYMLTIEENKAYIKCKSDGRKFVISPVMGLVMSWFTGQETLGCIYEKARTVFSENVLIKQYITKVGKFFGDFFIFSDKPINALDCMSVERFHLAELKPIYFDMLMANRLPGPKTIVFNVTNKCDFHCIYCYDRNNFRAGSVDMAELGRLKDFFAQAKEAGCEKVILTGGDPLLHPRIGDIISDVSSLKISTFLSTKTLVDSALAKKLADAGLSEIQCSIDSLSDEVNYRLWGTKISSCRIIDSLKTILEAGIPCGVKCVITSINIMQIPEMVEALLKNGVSKIAFNLYQGDEGDLLIPQSGEVEQLCRCLEKYKDDGFDIDCDFVKKRHICGSLMHTLYLNENGDVGLCFKDYRVEEFKLGNIADMSLQEIWNSEKAIKLLTPDQNSFTDKECRECSRFQKCIYYGCYYERYKLNGTPFSKAKECI